MKALIIFLCILAIIAVALGATAIYLVFKFRNEIDEFLSECEDDFFESEQSLLDEAECESIMRAEKESREQCEKRAKEMKELVDECRKRQIEPDGTITVGSELHWKDRYSVAEKMKKEGLI